MRSLHVQLQVHFVLGQELQIGTVHLDAHLYAYRLRLLEQINAVALGELLLLIRISVCILLRVHSFYHLNANCTRNSVVVTHGLKKNVFECLCRYLRTRQRRKSDYS